MYRSFIKFSLSTSVLMLGTLLPISLNTVSASAVEMTDGQTVFSRAPRLVRAAATYNRRRNPFAAYQFTIEVPEDGKQALRAVKIEQKRDINTVEFKGSKSSAFYGDSLAGGSPVSLAAVGGESQPGEITVEFEQPIEPGNTVTVSVKPRRNPFVAGVYQFGITAYPAGENSQGMYLGSRRINIYE